MRQYAGNGPKAIHESKSEPKIIVIIREPLERAWSSYKYSYVNPAMEHLRGSSSLAITEQLSAESYLFSFEDFIAAELKNLRDCLKPGGQAEEGARQMYFNQTWSHAEFERREREGLPPLLDLHEQCYDENISHSRIQKKQWSDLVKAQPHKVIDLPDKNLFESLIGRGLYALSLEWWYIEYTPDDIFVACNEDMRHRPEELMDELSAGFLGLPSFNFSNVIRAGLYNVATNPGYDVATKWSSEFATDVEAQLIPISNTLKAEFEAFVKPYNERLFALIGKRCDW